MSLRPWYKVVTPREDLREARPLDASEFAVHLDQVREGSAPDDYQEPARFFERTYLTQNLLGLAAGANVVYAESGANPRDTEVDTERNRGLDMAACRKMLYEAGFASLLRGDGSSVELDLNHLLA